MEVQGMIPFVPMVLQGTAGDVEMGHHLLGSQIARSPDSKGSTSAINLSAVCTTGHTSFGFQSRFGTRKGCFCLPPLATAQK